MTDRWQCRHSSCEMMYIDFAPGRDELRCYLDHSPGAADRWTFDDVLDGRHDAFIRNLFGDAAVRARRG